MANHIFQGLIFTSTITKKEEINSTELKSRLISKILFPLRLRDYEKQIEIGIRIKNVFKEIFIKFLEAIVLFLDSKKFLDVSNIEQVKFMKDILGSRILGLQGEIKIKERLESAEKILDELLQNNELQFEATSKEYANLESACESFKEKFYFLTYMEFFPI